MPSADVSDELKTLILDALKVQYISESCQDAVKTGNHYQSLALGDSTTEGFRSGRTDFLDRIDFEDRKVLDLGSNLGEMSRGARARGARLVDGFEYDPYFVEIADLVNVLNGTSRVSFYRRDITDPSIYGERYDIVLVLSVFIYAAKVVDRLAEITDVLFLETHKLRGNLEETYIDPISEYFPCHEVLGETEWGLPHDPGERRAILVFAKDEQALRATLLDRPRPPRPERGARAPEGFAADIDMRRTRLHDPFFERFGGRAGAATLEAVAEHELDLDALMSSPDAGRGYGGWTYWFVYLRGYLVYRETGTVDLANPYLRYLREFVGPQGWDPSLSGLLADDDAAITLVSRRFRDLAHYEDREGRNGDGYAPAEIRLIMSDPPRPNQPVLYDTSGELLSPRQLDGWHRLFGAALFELDSIPAEVVRADARPGNVLAVIEHLAYDGETVELRGWCLSPDAPLHHAQLTVAGARVANVELEDRDDVATWFPTLGHARRSGFSFRSVARHDAREPVDFAVTVMEDWLPVARLEVPHLPGMLTDRTRPPAELARRLVGSDDPSALAARTARAVEAIVAPLSRSLDLASVDAVLEWGVDTGLLEPVLASRLAPAAITGVAFDREALEWARAELACGGLLAGAGARVALPPASFELVIGCSVLARLNRAEQRAWLTELHRLTCAGGLLALTVQGELLRRFLPANAARRLERDGIGSWEGAAPELGWHPPGDTVQTKRYTIDLCSELFDVVDYAEGAVSDLEDLVVLSKRL